MKNRLILMMVVLASILLFASLGFAQDADKKADDTKTALTDTKSTTDQAPCCADQGTDKCCSNQKASGCTDAEKAKCADKSKCKPASQCTPEEKAKCMTDTKKCCPGR